MDHYNNTLIGWYGLQKHMDSHGAMSCTLSDRPLDSVYAVITASELLQSVEWHRHVMAYILSTFNSNFKT